MDIYLDGYGKEHKPHLNAFIHKRKGVFGIFISQGNLLVTWPKYCPERAELPGGGIEDKESVKNALIRETYEETNKEFTMLSPKKEYKQQVLYYADDIDQYFDYHQTFWLCKGKQIDKHFFKGEEAPADALKAAWVPLRSLKNFNLHKIHKRALQYFSIL